jgi:rSAM/selenodomain-associated transferase 1
VFARAPQLGRVKTRLAADVGNAAALAAYLELGRTCWHEVTMARRLTAARAILAFTPSDAEESMAAWLPGADAYLPQCAGDLGARMRHALERETAAGARRILTIGTDCPTLSAATIVVAFDSLRDADVVIGPATDGGYYLIGVREPHEVLFRDVPWSSDRTLAVTLERAGEAGLSVRLLEKLSDVDTLSDWNAWKSR